jgi:uncharacterized repeat protein (TIGR03803 family)
MISAWNEAFTENVLASFSGAPDAAIPECSLVRDAAGNLYGTSIAGGKVNGGAVFKLSATGKKKILYSFTGGADGESPVAGLVRDSAGNLYGTTNNGFGGFGTVFKIDTAGQSTVLHTFAGGTDGANPVAALIEDTGGNLYGTTYAGGSSLCYQSVGCGTVFKIDPSGNETILHAFTGVPDGAYPYAGLVRDNVGNLYGTTASGGQFGCTAEYGCGTVFKIDTTGVETVLYRFTGTPDGAYPQSVLVSDTLGNFYGTTAGGGAVVCYNNSYGCGTVFELDSHGNETVLYAFLGTPDGSEPTGNLVRDALGSLYGTTEYGGSSDHGTVFKLNGTGTEVVLHAFGGLSRRDGALPEGGLIRDAAGNLYGTTANGGSTQSSSCPYGCGTVFKLKP